MKTFKRFLASMLCVVIVLTAAPLSGFVGLNFPELNLPEWNLFDFSIKSKALTSGIYIYEVSNSEARITDCYTSVSGEISIPSTLDGYPVTSIGSSAFRDCTSLTSVIISDSVTSIDGSAFRECTSLTTITIPDSVTSIGYAAFYKCTRLKELTMPVSAKIYNSQNTFYGCKNIEKITLTKGNGIPQIYSTSTSHPDYTYYGYTPWYISGCSTVVIQGGKVGDYTFYNCTELNKVDIEDVIGGGFVGNYAFCNCSALIRLSIGNGVEDIRARAFYGCEFLDNIVLPDSIKRIASVAFVGTGYYTNTFNWENDVLYISNHLIKAKQSLSGSYIIKSGTKTVSDSAFYGCESLTTITIPDSVTNIGDDAFYNCTSLTDVYYIGDIKTWCEITFADYVSNPMDGAENFYIDNSLVTEIVIPDGVTEIKDYAFYGFAGVTSVTIPNSVTKIGFLAFDGTGYYDNTYNWENDVLYINDHLIRAKRSLSGSYMIKSGTKTISGGAFNYCTSLTSVTIPDSVTSIGKIAFRDCTSLTSVTIPDSVTSIGSQVFSGCISLTSVTIPDSVESIGEWAFYECISLTSVAIGDSVTSIGERAFYKCISLTSVTIPDSVESIGEYAFYYCDSLTSVTIPDSVESIGECAFSYCENLTSVIIGNNIASIGDEAFDCCYSLDDVYYMGTQDEWNSILFGTSNSYLKNANIHYSHIHSASVIDSQEATCISTGYKNSACVCGRVFELVEFPINPEAHVESEWKITIDPTTTQAGEKTKNCTLCNKVLKSEIIPMLDPVCDQLEWEITDGKVTITGCDENISGDIVIPDYIYECPVVSIAEVAFANTDITSMVIPESVQTIGKAAFAYCQKLKTINIPANITTLPIETFWGCTSLEKVIIDEDNPNYSNDAYGVVYNKDKTHIIYAPAKTVIDDYIMPETVKTSEETAFIDCKDFSITFSDAFFADETSTFFTFLSVNSFVTSDENENFKAVDGVLYNTDMTRLIKYPIDSHNVLLELSETVKEINESAFYVMEEEQEIIAFYEFPFTSSTFDPYSTPDGLVVHVKTVNDKMLPLLAGTSHVCMETMTTEAYELNSQSNDEISSLAAEWREIKDEVPADSAVYYLMYKAYSDQMNMYIEITSCGNNHESIHSKKTVLETKNSTCAEIGYVKYRCTCGYEFIEDNELIPHTKGESEKIKDPTCSEKGQITCKCTVCGQAYIEEIDTVPHISGTPVEENIVEPNCTAKGSYDSVVYCSVCNAELSRETIVLDAFGHELGEEVEENRTEPTCTEDGSYDSVVYCTVCDMELSRETMVIPAFGHTESEYVIENEVAATPTKDGSYDMVVYCTVCEEELSRSTIIIPALGHTSGDAVEENNVEPTCTTDGSYDLVVYCTCCTPVAEISRETIVVPATGHEYVSEVTVPTCTEQGYTTYTCSVCGDTYVSDEVESLGHTLSEAVEENKVDSTCTEKGLYDSVVYCSVCDSELSRETKSIPAKGHKWGGWKVTTEPTMITDGVKVRECSVCGETETGVSPKTGITITLTDSNGNIVSKTVVEGNVTSYSFSDLADGEYTVTVSKETYVSREYTVTATDGETAVEFKLNHIGDINGDGKVNTMDVARANASAKGTSSLSGYEFACADINGDGKVNTMDVARMNAHAKSVSTLW